MFHCVLGAKRNIKPWVNQHQHTHAVASRSAEFTDAKQVELLIRMGNSNFITMDAFSIIPI